MPGKMTMKDLSQEVEKLKEVNVEKDMIIKGLDDKMNNLQKWVQDIYSKFNISDQTHFKNAQILDKKIADVEIKIEEKTNDDTKKPNNGLDDTLDKKCRECSLIFSAKTDLKKHILAVHPKNYECRVCDKICETSADLELHLNSHDLAKQFKCDVCGKSFHMRWRLKRMKNSIKWKM